MKNLREYFNLYWRRLPIVDFHLRFVDELPDGSIHFYIHPQRANGLTADFIITVDGDVKNLGIRKS